MDPLVWPEIKSFDWLRALNNGLIPSRYLQDNFRKALTAHVHDYRYSNIARDCGVDSKEIRPLQAFIEEYSPRQAIVVRNETVRRA